MNDFTVKYQCKILPFGTAATIAIAVAISINVTLICTYIGLHPLVSTAIMIALMFVAIIFLSSEAVFTINGHSIERVLLSSNFLFKNKIQRHYDWNEVKSFKSGSDLSRFRGEFQFLQVKFRNGEEWKLTDMYRERKEAYDAFLKIFLTQVNEHNSLLQNAEATVPETQSFTQPLYEIKREKTFYQSISGKLFTMVIGVFIILIIVYGKGYMTASAVLKLNVVLIPGFLYLVYKTFIEDNQG